MRAAFSATSPRSECGSAAVIVDVDELADQAAAAPGKFTTRLLSVRPAELARVLLRDAPSTRTRCTRADHGRG